MKRVKVHSKEITSDMCSTGFTYLLQNENVMYLLCNDNRFSTLRVVDLSSTRIIDGTTDGYKTATDAINDWSAWDAHQFPDFRSAMQYYLEQTK